MAKKKIKPLVLNITLTISVFFVILAAVFGGTLFGYRLFLINSESMEPDFRKYALALVKYNTYDDVVPGDVIAFSAEALGGKPALHRVISVTPEGYVTKGDANKLADARIIGENGFLGREVWHTNFTAAPIGALMTPRGVVFMIIMPAFLIFLVILFVKLLKNAIKPKKPQKSTGKEESHV